MMDAGALALAHQAMRRYRSDLQCWLARLRAARTTVEAARLAAQPPHLSGPMAPAVKSLVAADRSRAIADAARIVEQVFEKEIAGLGPAHLEQIARLAGGHCPRVAATARSRIAALRRQAQGAPTG